MTARTAAPEAQLREQLVEMKDARAWFWRNREQPLTTPRKYAETAVDRILEGLVST